MSMQQKCGVFLELGLSNYVLMVPINLNFAKQTTTDVRLR